MCVCVYLHTHCLIFLSSCYSGHNLLVLLTPSFVVVDPPVNVTIAVDAAGSYEHLVYDREQFSLLGQSEFNVSLSQFSNFFQNFTFFATEDNLPSQFVITSVGSVGQKNVTVDTIVVQYSKCSVTHITHAHTSHHHSPPPPPSLSLSLSLSPSLSLSHFSRAQYQCVCWFHCLH